MTADKRLQSTRPSPRERQPPAVPPIGQPDVAKFTSPQGWTPALRVALAGSTG